MEWLEKLQELQMTSSHWSESEEDDSMVSLALLYIVFAPM